MAERLRGAFSDAVAAIAAEDMTARAEAGAALAQAFEQVEAELVVAELTARARASSASPTLVSADIARLDEDLRRKADLVERLSAQVLDWQQRLETLAFESSRALRTEPSAHAERPPLP
ncbi:hypothetical protein KFE25_010922 [Diacronema lutheri]|uniref:Uncharacterized protein n=1 Tax=Diacronema lutheri TaxID=2081491 RepID=A0A8J6C3L0_DIALT|nr:hypothetical protein KFE25_009799 [Diacronema lutheri]KAG8460867.1 hypothetical protein KFE25_010922 [Diacronema lutheri]